MTTARKQLVSVESTPYYHCVSRCVRRSFLCGIDPITQQNYQHRRDWIQRKIESLSLVYCIDICAYAIMSNHYHLVLHINRNKALALSPTEVVEHWKMNHKLPLLIQRWLSDQLTSKTEEKTCFAIIETWRTRLWNLSWFMKELNFSIACKANQEDSCTGHFWESRFKSQALLDEQALVAAMAYVDLNPLRAGIADKPESSAFTSIQARIKALKNNDKTAPFLFPFTNNPINNLGEGIPLRLIDYIELVDWSAKQYRTNKSSLHHAMPPILQRLNLPRSTWFKACNQLEEYRSTAIGSRCHVESAKRHLRKSRIFLFRLDS